MTEKKEIYANDDKVDSNTQDRYQSKVPAVPKAIWNEVEVDALLDYLIEHRSKLAGTTFKITTFNLAAAKITNKKTLGPMKTGVHCKNKFSSLKLHLNKINYWHNRSGCHWDNMHGTNIQGPSAEEEWTSYINSNKSNAIMKDHKNAGWEYHEKMEQILLDISTVQGVAAYNLAATEAAAATTASTSSGGPGGAAASGDVNMSKMDTDDDSSWDIVPLTLPTSPLGLGAKSSTHQ
ncbi:hypothetical protein DFH29DRAFT_1000100 [Suillus ampliporus]|nr:hypothetical protein DFH29DRAFT_1000100 [Suillus ampliporus]